jgi:parvulin-like peptidyl-prolyl isomerase
VTTRIALLTALAVLCPRIAHGAADARPSPAAPSGAAKPPAAAATAAPPATDAAKGESMRATLVVPLFSERFASVPVAAVEDEIITLRQLNDALAATHEARAGSDAAKAKDVTPILERLVDMRLLIREARDMELDKLPDVTKAVAAFKEIELRSALERRVTRNVKPDAMQVERELREAVREWKIRSLLFPAEADAKAFVADLRAGKGFIELARQAVESKKAKGVPDSDWIAPARLAPAVAAAVGSIAPGGATDPVAVEGGFTVVLLEEVRYPENPEERAKAEARSLDQRQTEALQQFRRDLEKKYARIELKLLQSLDFEAAKPGFSALMKDARPVAHIRGEKPITVGDLATDLAAGFFHGLEGPIKEKRVNMHKDETLRVLVTKRIFRKEANRLGLASTPEYRDAVAETERAQLFGKIVEKVIIPDVKVMEEEGKEYYEKHKGEFTYPAFYKLDGLAFTRSSAAAAALKRLQGGTDLGWLRANAEDQVPQDKRNLQLEGTTFSATALAPELVASISGADRGDYRLYEAPGSQYWVVRLLDRVAEKEQPYRAVRDGIVKKLFAEKVTKAVKEYAAKLREVHRVDVYITRIGT